MSYTVYCHTTPEGKKYVGMTKSPVSVRWGNGTRYKSCRLFNEAIEQYGWENISHEVISSGLSKEEADKLEHDLIEKWNLMDRRYGYHLREGGARGRPCEESRELMGKSRVGNQNSKCSFHSSENRKKISDSLRRYYKTHDNPMLGKKRPEIQGENNPNARSVVQMDMDNNTIAVYPSMTCASSETGIRIQAICNCCTGYRKSIHGYKWKYA